MARQNEVDLYVGIVVTMTSFVVIAGSVIVLFVRYHKKMMRKQKELHLLETLHKKELLVNSIQSAESERMRIAKDIHDEIGSIFSTLSLSVGQLTMENGQVSEYVVRNKGLIQSGINSVRRISHGIIPFELELLGLHQTLENYFESISSVSEIEIEFNCSSDLKLLNQDASLALYRIMQELFSNCLKYAGAKNTVVDIHQSDYANSLFVNYRDDGIGFDFDAKPIKKGIGLKNIESRVISMDGTVDFYSKPGNGFNCNIIFPIEKEA
ncbi:MAG: histidine kinase [Bacteroidota bacterium]|nr:histidine kinase [Bacteroidota bacterium]